MVVYSIGNVKLCGEPEDDVFRTWEYDFFKNGTKINYGYIETMGPVELNDLRKALGYMKNVDLSFHCMDCGDHTIQIEEYYTVHDEVWLYANPQDYGMLCIGCLESRLGRVLTPADFPDYPINREWGTKSPRLLDRLGR